METEVKENISELQYIKGIGPVRAKALASDGINDYFDLLQYFPRSYVDRTAVANIQALRIKLLQEDIFSNSESNLNINNHNEVTLIVRVVEKRLKTYGKNRKYLELILTDYS
jgi:RecG-like helicase